MVATYARMVTSLAEADEQGQSLMVHLARETDGLTALAVFCAQQGYTAREAAAAIGCDVAELDRAIEAFSAGILAEAARRRAARAA